MTKIVFIAMYSLVHRPVIANRNSERCRNMYDDDDDV